MNYLSRRAISITLILGLLISSLAFSASFPTLTTQAVGEGKWTDVDENGIYKYVDFSPFEDANATEYIVSTAAQLAAVAAFVNSYNGQPQAIQDINGSSANTTNFAGKKIQLTSDIDLEAHEWVPIGLANLHEEIRYQSYRIDEKIDVFKGSFDGGNHTIENMKIGEKDTPAEYKYAGLFGHVGSSGLWSSNTHSRIDLEDCIIIIENINIGKGSRIFAKNDGSCYVGSIAGAAHSTTIRNCINSGNVTTTSRYGGIGGIVYEAYGTQILNCSNNGDIKGIGGGGITCNASYGTQILNCSNAGDVSATVSNDNTFAGGIVKYMDSSTTIRNCSNSGNVSCKANESYVGGIAGDASGGTISNCSNSGNVSSTAYYYDSRVGGIVGSIDAHYTINISNCSNSGDVSAYTKTDSYSYNSYAGGIIGKISTSFSRSEIQILKNCSNSGNVSAAAARRSDCYAGGIAGAIINVSCNISNTYYLKGTAAKGIGDREDQTGTTALPEEQMKAASGEEGALVDLLNAWITENKAENPDLLYWYQNDELNNGYPNLLFGNWIDYADTSWYTEDEAEYTISTAAELAGLAVIVNEGRDDFAGKTITLGKDINLGGAKWTPIGNNDHPFRGTFDGANKTIENMSISLTEYSNTVGLFGRIDNESIIKNVNVSGSISVRISNETPIFGGIHIGGVVGFSYNSMISNCNSNVRINSNITDPNNQTIAGGIVGNAIDTTVINCSNSGVLECDSEKTPTTGGIAGIADGTEISNCSNNGDIKGSWSGGIAGEITDTTIINSSNSGNISAITSNDTDSFAGGIVGTAGKESDIVNCSNTGNVKATNDSTLIDNGSNFYTGASAGGIAGIAIEEVTISNCINGGNVSASSTSKELFIGGIVGLISKDVITSDNYYKNVSLEGERQVGIGAINTRELGQGWELGEEIEYLYPDDEAGKTTALTESQMKASFYSVPGAEWVEIPIAENRRTALVNALNIWVEQNKVENPELLSWKQNNDNNNGYPYLSEEADPIEPEETNNGWKQNNETLDWSYYENGQAVTGWKDTGNATYYFDEYGIMQKDWQYINGDWYYFYEEGIKAGQLARNTWDRGHDTEWYYVDENGIMVTGWKDIGDATYYFDEIGKMASNWQVIGNEWYYFYEDDENGDNRRNGLLGKLAKNMWERGYNGEWYYADENGKMSINSWHTAYYNGIARLCFVGADGKMVKDDWRVDPNGNMRYLLSDGRMVNGLIGTPNGDGTYTYTYNQQILNGWQQLGTFWYYFENGQMIKDDWRLGINGYRYYLFSNGRMLDGLIGTPNGDGNYTYSYNQQILNGLITIENKYAYCFRNGQIVTNETVDGYQFGADGKALNYVPAA